MVLLPRLALLRLAPSDTQVGPPLTTMREVNTLMLASFGTVLIMLGFVACWGTPEDRAEATRAAIRNAPVACAIYLTDERIPKEPALDEICRAVAGIGESDAVRSDEVPPSGTGSAVQPTRPELPDGGVIHTTPGNGARNVE